MAEPNVVAIVDDDAAVRDSTAALLRSANYDVVLFESGDTFLNAALDRIDCVLLDMRMPGADGIDVLRQLGERANFPSVVVLTGHGELSLAVEAMKLGAMDFLEKPYEAALLLGALKLAISNRQSRYNQVIPSKEALAQIGKLTVRQREVLCGLLSGHPNKIMAWKLGLSVRTIEAYRAEVMARLQVRSVAEAVQIALAAGLAPMNEGDLA